MARQRQTVETKRGLFGGTKNLEEVLAAERNNRKVNVADQYLSYLPKSVQERPVARNIADKFVDLQYLPQNRACQTAAAVAGVATLGGGALKAYSDQRNDYLPAGPIDVAGRMVSNLFPAPAVSADPLAAARNNVAAAAELVGSEAMVEGLAADQIREMRGTNQAAMTPLEFEQMTSVQKMVDERAKQLMQQPIQKSVGSVGPVPYDTAQKITTEQINMELRANNAY
ncbi:hypothetical protein ACLM45_05770 [Synechococcus sp. A10-1-5-9]|uniref:hypothetical protein n=1 Tax=Synechococcus sp. A10-1-5-9 TaxID=3392295 RepID=UPI0039EC499A